ncbi:ATP synthase subunit I [Saccharobesus litoralis]|uniref:ATP synthase subunit I n=1 Tax=Saccharobesus litoralis TaxID=2172099 RepID=UPI002E338EC9|nr:ATP synthase subunit I [Saccharobesus litoralis]
MNKPLLLSAMKLIGLQAGFVVIASLIVLILWGDQAGKSALYGGIIATLPNAVFALYSFRFAGARQIQQVYASLKRGVAFKYLLSILLFALVFKTTAVVLLPFFIVYLIAISANWFAPIFFN